MRYRTIGFLSLLLALSVAGCGKEPSGPTGTPNPGSGATLSYIAPNSALVGSAALVLRVEGANFVPGSAIEWAGEKRPTVYETAGALTAEIPASDLAVQGVFPVTVVSPEGATATNEGAFQVIAPVPTLSSLSTTEFPVNEPAVLEIRGDGFYDGSIVQFASTTLPAEFVDGTRLIVNLKAEHVTLLGPRNVSVLNPEPGGGESNALELTIIPATPSLAFLSSEGASAGRPGFDLHVFGTGFRPTAQAYWNGDARPTTHLSHEQLVVAISASDVAAPGTASITVQNPAPSGPAPEALALTVRPVGAAAVTSMIEVEVPANDVGYSKATGLLYASVSSSGGPLGNTIIAIDPTIGSIVGSVFVGSEPISIAISDDGLFLWVALDGAGAVRGVDLTSLTAGTQFGLTSGFAEEIDVAPGTRRTVAISHRSPDRSPRYTGVVIYDDGVPRPDGNPAHTGANTISFNATGDFIYGFNSETSDFSLFTLEVDALGVRPLKTSAGLINAYDARVSFANGRIFSTSGEIIDAGRHVLAGNLGRQGEAVGIDADLGRAFVLDGNMIDVVDLNTFQSLGTLSVTLAEGDDRHLSYHKRHLVRWGSDGLAFRDATRIYILRSPLAGG